MLPSVVVYSRSNLQAAFVYKDQEQRLLMDKVTVEDVFRPCRGWLSSILCIGRVHEPCRQSLFCVSVGRNSRKHRCVTESGTKLRWLGEGSDWAGWHIDTRDGELSMWFHPDFQSLEPPVKGWQFWHGGKYRNSVLLLQSVVDGQVVPLHKAVLGLCALSLLRLTLNSAGPPVREAHASARRASGGSAFAGFALGRHSSFVCMQEEEPTIFEEEALL